MKKSLALASFLAAAAFGSAVTLSGSFGLGNIPGVDYYGDLDNFSASVDIGSAFGGLYENFRVTGISYDVTLEALSPSWLLDMTVAIENSDASGGVWLTPGFGDDVPGTATYTSDPDEGPDGFVDLVQFNLDFDLLPDNVLYFEFFDTFQDFADGISEGTWNGEIGVRFEADAVPEPATLAVLGLAVAAFRRRSRK